jgi:hypothetical protein
MPLLNRVDALNEDRLGKGASNFAMLLTRAVKNVNAERGSGQPCSRSNIRPIA